MAGLLDEPQNYGNGLLGFIQTPAGQGLLAAVAGGLAGARRGAPLNSLGNAALAGLQGYSGALERNQQAEQFGQMSAYRNAQARNLNSEAEKRAADLAQEAKLRALPEQFRTPAVVPGAPGTGGTSLVNSALPHDMQIGALAPLSARPAGFDRQGFGQALESLDPVAGHNYLQSINKIKAPISLAAGSSLIDPETFKPVFTAPTAPEKEPEPIRQLKAIYGDGTPEYLKAAAAYGQKFTTHTPPVTVNMGDGQKGFENEMKLGAAFKQEPIYKDHAAVQSAFSQINAALAQGSPISDTAAATKIMKILDPGSVVRESELGMAMAAGGRMDRLQNYLKQSMDGTKLTPQQRTDFGNLASELTAASAQTYNGKRMEYHHQGKDYGLNADRALGKPVPVPSIQKTATTEGLSITAPNGKTYKFKNEREMANFKMATGVK